jgi:hypothetical protein
MSVRIRFVRWFTLVATLAVGAAWIVSRQAALWLAPPVGGGMAVVIVSAGVAYARLDSTSSAGAAPPLTGLASVPPMGVFPYH